MRVGRGVFPRDKGGGRGRGQGGVRGGAWSIFWSRRGRPSANPGVLCKDIIRFEVFDYMLVRGGSGQEVCRRGRGGRSACVRWEGVVESFAGGGG